MKKFISFLSIPFFFIPIAAYSQSNTIISSNEISANINGNGALFRDYKTTGPQAFFKFQGTNSDSSTAIFQSNLWLAAKDNKDSLFVSADLYNGGDFFEGTINNAGTSSVKVFVKIDKASIDFHKLNYSTSGYVMPESIDKWPTTGDISIGESLALAPFVDIDNNGCYEPEKGDYPFIKGDEAVYFIMNDNSNVHTSSKGSPIGLEIHVMVYYFNSTVNSGLNSSLMVDYELRNR